MLTTLQNSLQTCKLWLLRTVRHPHMRTLGQVLASFFLSAAALADHPQPLTLGLLLACPGSPWTALGGVTGYLVFWGKSGIPCVLWLLFALPLKWVLCNVPPLHRHRTALPAAGGFLCALTGFLYPTSLPIHLLQTAMAVGMTWLFSVVSSRRETVADWMVSGAAVLALAQVAPLPILSLGYPAAAALTVCGAFPAAAMAGLALDLSGITTVSMTAVLSLAWLTRFALDRPAMRAISPALACTVMTLLGRGSLLPIPGLLLGGLLGLLLPGQKTYTPRRGEVGVAQVRLELASASLRQMLSRLLELPKPNVDEDALFQKVCENACGGCSVRRNCPGRVQLRTVSAKILTQPELLPQISCRRSGRLLQELLRGQEQLRLLHAGNARTEECRAVLTSQYRSLSEYLQSLSDELSRRGDHVPPRYRLEVQFSGNRLQSENGDRCLTFTGTGCRAFVLLCDGMGTGTGAAEEARLACEDLRCLLSAGFPTEQALVSLNTLCALRQQAGAVTVDLAEVHLDTGRLDLYNWGAAPSWLLSERGSEKIGTAGPPPGLSVTDTPETAHRLSLRRGELLVMRSDGAGGEEIPALHADQAEPLEQLCARLLTGRTEGTDDATVALVRLHAL